MNVILPRGIPLKTAGQWKSYQAIVRDNISGGRFTTLVNGTTVDIVERATSGPLIKENIGPQATGSKYSACNLRASKSVTVVRVGRTPVLVRPRAAICPTPAFRGTGGHIGTGGRQVAGR